MRDPQLISRPDNEFHQNHSDDDLTDKDDDLPSLRDLLEWKWKRNPDVIDLTAEDDVVGALSNPKISRDLNLAGLEPLIAPVSSPRDNHCSIVSGPSPIFCDHSATTSSVAYTAIRFFYNTHRRYDFSSNSNTEEDAVQKHTVVVSVSRCTLANIRQILGRCQASCRDGEWFRERQ